MAIERQGGPLYPVVAGMARALLATSLPAPARALPTFADPLEDERTGLRRLSEHLLVPVKSGWFLSRGDLLRLADAAACPCGFGSRLQMMEAYFRTAVEHDLLPRAVEVLQAELDVWVEACNTQAPEWSRRALATRAVVQRLIDRA